MSEGVDPKDEAQRMAILVTFRESEKELYDKINKLAGPGKVISKADLLKRGARTWIDEHEATEGK